MVAPTSDTVAEALGLSANQTTPKGGSALGSSTTPKTSFAEDTNFIQKKGPGSCICRSKSPVTNPYAKATVTASPAKSNHEHDYHTYIRVQINLKRENDVPTAIQKILGNFLSVLQQKDPNACFKCNSMKIELFKNIMSIKVRVYYES